METSTAPAAFADAPTGPGLWFSIALTQYDPDSPIIPTTCLYRVVETENGLMDTYTDSHNVTEYRPIPDTLNPQPPDLRSIWHGPIRNSSDFPCMPTAYLILALQHTPDSTICIRTVRELWDGTTSYSEALQRHPAYLADFRRIFPDVDLEPGQQSQTLDNGPEVPVQ